MKDTNVNHFLETVKLIEREVILFLFKIKQDLPSDLDFIMTLSLIIWPTLNKNDVANVEFSFSS